MVTSFLEKTLTNHQSPLDWEFKDELQEEEKLHNETGGVSTSYNSLCSCYPEKGFKTKVLLILVRCAIVLN